MGRERWVTYDIDLKRTGKKMIVDGFCIPIKIDGDDHIIWLAGHMTVKFMGKTYKMDNPKDFVTLKGIYETEVALANLD